MPENDTTDRDGDDEPLDIDRGMDDTIARIEAGQHGRSDALDEGESEDAVDRVEEFERIETAVEDVHEGFAERLGELGNTIEVTIGDCEVSLSDGKTVDVPDDEIQVPTVDLETVKEAAEAIRSRPPEFNPHSPETVPNRDGLPDINRGLDDTIARIEAGQHGCEDETGSPRGQPAINIRGSQHGREDETGANTEDGEPDDTTVVSDRGPGEWPPEDADMTLAEALKTAPSGAIVYTGRCSGVGNEPLLGDGVTIG
jgi:hypothetical protein